MKTVSVLLCCRGLKVQLTAMPGTTDSRFIRQVGECAKRTNMKVQ